MGRQTLVLPNPMTAAANLRHTSKQQHNKSNTMVITSAHGFLTLEPAPPWELSGEHYSCFLS